MKKITSLLLILTMFASLLPTMVFAAENSAFTDVKGTEYYADAANTLSSLNILLGYEDGTFGAEKSITRSEMAAIVCRMIDKENEAEKAEGKTNFDDVEASHWASGYINIASKEGIINGDGNGKFRPEDDVKYEEAIKMVVCALGFGDGVKVDEKDWSAEYLEIANEKGITDNLKGVKNIAATRGDIAVMVYNGLKTDLAVPTASFASGSYTGTKSITLTTATNGADIYYTTDGTTPTVKSTKYTKAVSISKTTTLKAIAVKSGVLVSDVMSADYTIKRSSSGRSTSKYTVTFDLNYDEKKITQSVAKGNLAIKPEIDNREGYVFGGWYKDRELTDPFDFENDALFENITLYASWNTDSISDLYTVTFDLNYVGAGAYESQTVEKGKYVNKPIDPKREGYAFGGWFTDDSCEKEFGFNDTLVNNDITIYAKWGTKQLIINDETYITTPDYSNIELDKETAIEYVNNELILHMVAGTPRDKVLDLINSYEAAIIGELGIVNTYQIKLNKNYTYSELKDISKQLEANENVLWVSLNMVFDESTDYFPTRDTKWSNQWSNTPGGLNWGVEAIRAPQAWEYRNDMEYVNVGVFDNCFYDHEDITYNQRYFNYPEKVKDDHGTHVSGTIGSGFDNDIGISGVAPKVNLYGFSYQSITNRSHLMLHELAFTQLIAMDHCKVINFSNNTGYVDAAAASYGDAKYINKIKSAAEEDGKFLQLLLRSGEDFTICVAAGNHADQTFYRYENKKDSSDVQYYDEKVISKLISYNEINFNGDILNAKYNNYLSSIEIEEVKNRIIVVGACKNNGNNSYTYSNFAQTGNRVDVLAPGEDIYSTIANNSYKSLPGTSMATPHVSGVAAMLYALNPNIKGDKVKNIIVNTANIDVNPKDNTVRIFGNCYKMINAEVAVKSLIGFNVYFDSHGGSMNTESISVKYGDYYGDLPIPTRKGYVFEGWYLNGKEITSDSIVDIVSDVTLIAHWVNNGIKISLDANGGSVSPNSITVNYGDTYGTLPTPVREGYTFDGWYFSNGYEKITSNSVVDVTEDSTLIALWSPKTYTITFNANGGETPTVNKTVTYDSKYGTLPKPTRDGYEFEGWYTSNSFGTEVTEDDTVKILSNITLYAKWKESTLPTTVTISPWTPNQVGQFTAVQGTLYSTDGEYMGSSYGAATWTCNVPSGMIPGYILYNGYMGNYQVGGIYRFTDNDYRGLKQYYYGETVTATATVYTGYKGSYSDFEWTWPKDFDWSMITQ